MQRDGNAVVDLPIDGENNVGNGLASAIRLAKQVPLPFRRAHLLDHVADRLAVEPVTAAMIGEHIAGAHWQPQIVERALLQWDILVRTNTLALGPARLLYVDLPDALDADAELL